MEGGKYGSLRRLELPPQVSQLVPLDSDGAHTYIAFDLSPTARITRSRCRLSRRRHGWEICSSHFMLGRGVPWRNRSWVQIYISQRRGEN